MKIIFFITVSVIVLSLMIYDPLFGWMTLAFFLFFSLLFSEFRSAGRNAKTASKDETGSERD